MTNIIVVDDNDKVIDNMSREDVDKNKKLRYRVTALYITNNQGQILLARRAFTKSHNPGKWGPAVAGTVEENETYESNIIKEAEEELGLKNLKLTKGPKVKVDQEHKYYAQWFSVIVNKPTEDFQVQTEEVAEIKWFSKEELLKQLEQNPNDFVNAVENMLNFFK
ncbi:MAG: NUDIX domain-containing protein [Candidatus Pacearchaeota archaeon]|jgi:isopentenyl-diphosphate delta-isomerase